MTASDRVEVAPAWGQSESVWQPRRAAFWLLVAFAVYGLAELSVWVEFGFDAAPEAMGLAVALWIVYAGVFLWLIARLDLLEPEPRSMLAAAFLWGALVSTAAAAQANTALLQMLTGAAGSQFTTTWGAAIVGPVTEETLKVLGIVVLVLIASRQFNNLVDGFVYGAIVGLGFQVAENLFYSLRAIMTSTFVGGDGAIDAVLQLFFIRGFASGLWTHATWTAIAGIGIAYFVIHKNQGLPKRIAVAIGLYLVAIAFHFAWNSPWLQDVDSGSGFTDLVLNLVAKGLPALVLLIALYWFARRREVVWFDDALSTQVDLVPPDDLAALHTMRGRRAARRTERQRHGTQAGRIRKELQRAQVQLAVAIARSSDPRAPAVAIGRADVRARREELERARARAAASAAQP